MLRPGWVTLISELTVDPESRPKSAPRWASSISHSATTRASPKTTSIGDVAHWAPPPRPGLPTTSVCRTWPCAPRGRCGPPDDRLQAGLSENAATPNLVVHVVPSERRRRCCRTWRRGSGRVLRRRQNAFKTIVLDEGADADARHNMEQMTYAAVKAAARNRIAVAAVYPIVAGLRKVWTPPTTRCSTPPCVRLQTAPCAGRGNRIARRSNG